MKCIIGLGNPGRKYENTRHNVGFMVIDELARRHHVTLDKSKFKNDYTIEFINGEKVMFVKPQPFMNLSGESVRPLIDYYNVDVEDIVILYDDLDLPAGKIRLRHQGGHGGHNGMRSLINHLGTKQFKRIRIGIGRPTDARPIVDYVLQPFTKDQQKQIELSIMQSADACEQWLDKPFEDVMNENN